MPLAIDGPVALIGANGMLARMVRMRIPEGLELAGYDLPDFDITDKPRSRSILQGLQPRVIINCAAFTAVDACEAQEQLAAQVNAAGAGHLADIARDLDAVLVHISTDYVFPGTLNRPYREDDAIGPISAYGRTKLAGEQAIVASGLRKYYILRTSWLYGPHGANFVETILRLAEEWTELRIVADQIGSPTFAGDLAEAIFKLLEAGAAAGIYHFANEGECSWFEFAQQIVAEAKASGIALRAEKILPITTAEYPLPARRPAYSVLDKEKYKLSTGQSIPDWRDSLQRYFAMRQLCREMGVCRNARN